MPLGRRTVSTDKADRKVVGLARDLKRNLLALEPHCATALALHGPSNQLARNLPLAFADHVINCGGNRSQPPRNFAFRNTRGESARKLFCDEAGGKPALAPSRMAHQRGEERNIVPDAVDIK